MAAVNIGGSLFTKFNLVVAFTKDFRSLLNRRIPAIVPPNVNDLHFFALYKNMSKTSAKYIYLVLSTIRNRKTSNQYLWQGWVFMQRHQPLFCTRFVFKITFLICIFCKKNIIQYILYWPVLRHGPGFCKSIPPFACQCWRKMTSKIKKKMPRMTPKNFYTNIFGKYTGLTGERYVPFWYGI